ncbi:Immunity protein 35 domain-containing protein OS=Streptomyces lavendulae subsp. lavendulae OX=58340 GN=SLAV_00430 PE=4 SV=1 [Streptomyces lavendulae subsp. lavendulae]
MIGSVSVSQQTWLWSWANESLPHAALGDMERVRQFGEENDYPVLPWPDFTYDPELVAEARMVAASVLDAEGLWAESMDDVQLHFMIHDLALAAERQ